MQPLQHISVWVTQIHRKFTNCLYVLLRAVCSEFTLEIKWHLFVQGWVCAQVRQICVINALSVESAPALFCMSLRSVTCVCLCERMLADVHAQGKLPLASSTLTSHKFPPTVWRQQECVRVIVCVLVRVCVCGRFLCDAYFQPSGYKEGG